LTYGNILNKLILMEELEKYSTAAKVWALREFGEVGPRTFRALMARFGDLENIHQAGLDELASIEGLGEKRSQKIFESSNSLDSSTDFIEMLDGINVDYATIFDSSYPELFKELNDPPPFIFYRGELPADDEKTVGLVGSHKASNDGIAVAVNLAQNLSERSVSVVSGLARGIDSAAHIGALKGKGRTYAIIGSGLEHVYPEENRPLAAEIIRKGALITEYKPDAPLASGKLMARNRLIVGLSQAVIIGEVLPDSSGTLDTATFCHQVGKLMFILTDNIDKPGVDNSGVDKVLELGAIPVNSGTDIDTIVKSLV